MIQENWKKDGTLKIVMDRIGINYEIVNYIGGGGLSKIYTVRQKFFDELRVLKVMDVDYLSRIFEKSGVTDTKKKFENIKERFISEIKIFEKISHPNIAKIFDIGFVKDEEKQIEIPYLIMQYIDGVPLRDTLKKDAPLYIERIFRFSEDILSALDEIHKNNVIHRDIKPANIMINNNDKAILIDFGLAKDTEAVESLTKSVIMGTPAYIAPEILSRKKDIGPGSDIYSFGVVLYEMAAGEKPYEGASQVEMIYEQLNFEIPDVTKRNPDAPEGLRKIIKKSMEKNPENRYKNATEVLESLRNLREELKGKSGSKPFKFKYLISLLVIIAAAAFIVINPLGIGKKGININNQYLTHITTARQYIQAGDFEKAGSLLDKAKKIKNSPEIKELSLQISIARMKKDFEALETFLKGDFGVDEKIGKCREFLDHHNNTPGNTETKLLISRANEFIKQLEDKKQTNDECQTLISEIRKHIGTSDYEKAHASLEAARKACSASGSAGIKELEDTIYAGCFSACENFLQKGNHREAKKTLLVAQKIKPNSNLKDMEDVIAVSSKAKTVRKQGKYWDADFGDGIVMVYIPSGEFLMGEGEGRKAILPGYWMQKSEVPVSQYMKFVKEKGKNYPEWLEKENRRNIETGEDKEYYKNFTGDNYPMVGISWNSAKAYCDWLSNKTGLTFKLPSDAQWEKAARGTDGRLYPWGKNSLDKNLANYDNLDGTTREVGAYPGGASPYGLLNMIGNVEEWCDDLYSKNDPDSRAVRGGSFITRNPDWLTSFFRQKCNSSERRNSLGFRLCIVNI